MKTLRTLLNVGFVIMTISIMMLKEDIFVISPENIQVLHIDIVISILKQIIKSLSFFTQLKKL